MDVIGSEWYSVLVVSFRSGIAVYEFVRDTAWFIVDGEFLLLLTRVTWKSLWLSVGIVQRRVVVLYGGTE
jgi:hypothetical protein